VGLLICVGGFVAFKTRQDEHLVQIGVDLILIGRADEGEVWWPLFWQAPLV
jgi:hypothetical protein